MLRCLKPGLTTVTQLHWHICPQLTSAATHLHTARLKPEHSDEDPGQQKVK